MDQALLTIPDVIHAINNSNDDSEINRYENIMICMFFSPVMLLSAILIVVVPYLMWHGNVAVNAINSLFFLLAGVAFEVLRKMRRNPALVMHLISVLYSAVLLFSAMRFYHVIGPAIWTFGFIQVLLALIRSSRTMLTYTSISLFLAGIYITFGARSFSYQMGILYFTIQFVLFALLFVVSLAVNNLHCSRYERIKSQFLELYKQAGKRKEAEEKIIKMALYDQLTGLPNRMLFNDRLEQACLQAKRNKSALHVLFLDLDMFKMVNDTMGHSIGDELLKQVSERLVAALRKTDVVARIGGDEFLLFMQGVKNEKAMNAIAGHLLAEISAPYQLSQRMISISCSIGIAEYPNDGQDVESLVKFADLAMYNAKSNGRNKFEYFTRKLENSINYEMSMINSLQNAMQRKELELYYQPQVDSASGEITGFEALLRWNHPVLGIISPLEFIPLAEKTGLIVPIGEWVLRSACQQNKQWENEGFANVPVSVNISTHQFKTGLLVRQVTGILAETGLTPSHLELEIAEKVLISEFKAVKEELQQLTDLGVRIAIDDFGTGYCGLQYLKKLPISRIKIPMEFIHGIDVDARDESVVTVILALAENLKIDVVAEGVETDKQINFLRQRFCANMQGFYFYKPMQVSNLNSFLRKAT